MSGRTSSAFLRARSLAFSTIIALALFFGLFVAFLYGPMLTIFVLSFQGPEGGLTFPLNGVSTHWFAKLWRDGLPNVDIWSAFRHSVWLGLVVMLLRPALVDRRRHLIAGEMTLRDEVGRDESEIERTVQGGVPIAQHQSVKSRLFRMFSRIEAAGSSAALSISRVSAAPQTPVRRILALSTIFLAMSRLAE